MKTDPNAPDMIVAIEHHQARIFHMDTASHDATEHTIKPHDPHHFRHHLAHHNQDAEQGQRAPEDPAFYEQIAKELAGAGHIVIVGHGTGHSNAGHHLAEHLRAKHTQTAQRLQEITADLSAMTDRQLLSLAREKLKAA